MALEGSLTLAEAAGLLGLAKAYIYLLIQRGELEALRVGDRMLLVRAESVRKLKPRPSRRPPKKGSRKGK